MPPQATLDDVWRAIGRLESESKQHSATHERVLDQLEEINEKLAPVAAVAAELGRHRDQDEATHNGFRMQLGADDKRMGGIEGRVAVIETERATSAKRLGLLSGLIGAVAGAFANYVINHLAK
jgi:hypothetical protein